MDVRVGRWRRWWSWARRPNQSIPKEINTEYSLEGPMLQLKFLYFGHLFQWRAGSLEKTLTLGKIEGKRRKRSQRMKWWDGITNSMEINLSKLQEAVEYREAWCAAVHGITKSWTQLNDWKTKNKTSPYFNYISDIKYFPSLKQIAWSPESCVKWMVDL